MIGLISAAGGTQGLQVINTMEFVTRALRGWAAPYVVPVATAARVFDHEGRMHDQAVELQLKTLRGEVVRVAQRFAADCSLHRATECARAPNASPRPHSLNCCSRSDFPLGCARSVQKRAEEG